MLTLDKVYHASFVLKNVIRSTDLIHAPNIRHDCTVYLKTENLQVTGSFKVRGAYYKISQLSDEEKAHGVIACSAGNHAQGVALAATKNGIKSVICLPDGAPISKVEATKKYGARVELVRGCTTTRTSGRLSCGMRNTIPSSTPSTMKTSSPDRGRSASSCSNSFPRSTPWWCRSAAAD